MKRSKLSTSVAALTRRSVLATGAAALAMPALTGRGFAQEAVNVGVIVPLSGANAQFGINSRNGIQMRRVQVIALAVRGCEFERSPASLV